MSAREPPGGPVIGIETSGREGSAALWAEGRVIAMRALGEPRRHSAGLVPALRELLDEAGLELSETRGVAVGSGPGSFTGVRVAAATAKALAATLGVPLYAVSSLRAAAAAGPAPQGADREIRHVLFDARRGRVYGACYDVGAADAAEVAPPRAATIVDVINARPPRGTVFVGDGAEAHAGLIAAAGFAVRPPPAGTPTAAGVLQCCGWEPVDAAAWEPDYLREWRPG